MTADERTRAELARLRAEILATRVAMDLLARRALGLRDTVSVPTPGDAALVAVTLHGWYNAAEQTLERVALSFEGSVPRGADSHRALLRSMMLDLGDVRPAVIMKSTESALAELLKFRNFFRHAYATELHWDRLVANVDQLQLAHVGLGGDLDVLLAMLDELISGPPPR